LTHILSYLHPDSYAAMALVSKQFYTLVKTPHAWKIAFQRLYSNKSSVLAADDDFDPVWEDQGNDVTPSNLRYFTRLTGNATWQSEYILRSQLLRGLVNGRPSGSVDSSGRLVKRFNAVLTYDSRIPCVVTNIYADFTSQKGPQKVIHGGADLGVGSMSNPMTGKIDKWGLADVHTLAQVEELFPTLPLYGVAEGPAGLPNVMDVSPTYGFIVGEGFPGGYPYFRPSVGHRARYVDHGIQPASAFAEVPAPSADEAISSVWIAKYSNVPMLTHTMVGMMTGSTTGIMTSYSLGRETARRRFQDGDMACRWALSPGVPIIALKVDENYTFARRAAGRVWAVALNALGEVFYLKDIPEPVGRSVDEENMVRNAWLSGRSVEWHLLESTRRKPRSQYDQNGSPIAEPTLRGPRSSSNFMNLSTEDWESEALGIGQWSSRRPMHFRDTYQGWDMRRRLEVDFAADDGNDAGEAIFVIDCGYGKDQPARVQRYARAFSQGGPRTTTKYSAKSRVSGADTWSMTAASLRCDSLIRITSSALDTSNCALSTLSEDPLVALNSKASASSSTTADHAEIPGDRARLLAVGTDKGTVMIWNGRDPSSSSLSLVKLIHTDSPEVSSLALTALYLVHGGSDGLVQAWDPLSANKAAIRTINTRSGNRVPRHLAHINPALRNHQYSAATSICLHPDPTKLCGVVAFGAFIRSWSYGSAAHPSGRKRSKGGLDRADLDDLDQESERNQWLKAKFGPGELGDLTEEESLLYALMMSEESFVQDEIRRATSDTGSFTGDGFESASSSFSTVAGNTGEVDIDALTAEASAASDDFSADFYESGDPFVDDYFGGVPASTSSSPGEFGFPITYKKRGKKSKKPATGNRGGSPP